MRNDFNIITAVLFLFYNLIRCYGRRPYNLPLPIKQNKVLNTGVPIVAHVGLLKIIIS